MNRKSGVNFQSLTSHERCLRLDPFTMVIVLRVDSIPMNLRYVDENGLYGCKLVYQVGLCKFVD